MKPSQIRIKNRGRYLILGIATILWIMPSVHAQTFEWAALAGGSSAGTSSVPETDRAIRIASDASNFVYVTGSFKDQAQFGTTTITSAGGRDAFLARYRTDGKLDWVKALGGPADDDGFGVATDGGEERSASRAISFRQQVSRASPSPVMGAATSSWPAFQAREHSSGSVRPAARPDFLTERGQTRATM